MSRAWPVRVLLLVGLLSVSLVPVTVAADDAQARRLVIHLAGAEAEDVELGVLEMLPPVPGRDGTPYRVTLDSGPFVDKFLSMRPFRCLDTAGTWLCHLPYPYDKPAVIIGDDLRNLEYDLMFVEKTPEEYGINAWNGRYFRLERTDDGFAGTLHEVDLNVLAAPPEAGVTWPVTQDMLHPADPAVHRYPHLRISP